MCQTKNTTGINCPNCAWARANGFRLRPTLMFDPKIRSGVPLGGYKVSLEKLSEKRTDDRPIRPVNKTKHRKPSKEHTVNNENITKKPLKRPQTQSERSKARKMKRRQLQQNEIAAKRANSITITTSPATATELKIEDIKIDVPKVETGVAPKTVNQKKKPRTHFRKTKKPGRA